MFKLFAPALLLVTITSGAATAACPAAVPGNTAEAIKANEQRIICLQRQASDETDRRQYEMELNQIETRVNQLEIQRRFDNLPVYTPPTFNRP
jgi:TolA-binding protein